MATNRKRYNKPIDVAPRMDSDDKKSTHGHTTRHNDVSWYAKDPRLVVDAASVPFAEPLGPDVAYGPNTRSVPGVCVLYYTPVVGPIGSANPGQAPINLAALNYYSWIRHANSGSRNYDPNDLIQIMLGIAGAYEVIAFCKRVYSLLRDYKMENRYYSKRIIEAMNLDFDDLLLHIADLRYAINTAIARVGIFALPKDMSFLLRRIWMCESIFLDAPMRKAQTYIYSPLYMQAYDWHNAKVTNIPFCQNRINEFSVTDGDNVDYTDGPITALGLMNSMDALIGRLSFNTDIGIISGDLLKAYGEAGLFKMEQIAEDFHIEPVFNSEVLTQIHNTVFACSSDEAPRFDPANRGFDLVQNGALLAYDSTYGNPWIPDLFIVSPHSEPQITGSTVGVVREDKHIIDVPIDPVNAGQIMVATRNMLTREVQSYTTSGTASYAITDFGTEVFLFAKIFSLNARYYYSTWLLEDAYVSVSDLLKYTMPFSFLPRAYVFTKTVDTPTTGSLAYVFNEIEVGTIDNYTIISDAILNKMHQTAVISEFSIPLSGLSRR